MDRAGFRVIPDNRIICRNHGAVDNVHGQRRRDSDVDRAVFVGNCQRDRHGGRCGACGESGCTKGKNQRQREKKRRYAFEFHVACLSATKAARITEPPVAILFRYLSGQVDLRRSIPLDYEHNACDGGVITSAGQRSDDSRIVDSYAVAGGVASTGHVAARDGSRDKRLRSSVRSGLDLLTAANAHSEAELIAVHLFTGKRSLTAERGQMPVGRGSDGDGFDANRAVGVVDNLAVSSGHDIAVIGHSHRKRGRNDDIELGRGRAATAADTVVGGGQVDRGCAGAARCANLSGKGGDGHGAYHAERKAKRNELGEMLFHRVPLSAFRLKMMWIWKKGDFHRPFYPYSIFYLRRSIPLDDEHYGCDSCRGHRRGKRSDDGAVIDADGVACGVAHAAHVAAGHRRGDESLSSFVGSVGLDSRAAADGEREAEFVGIDLLTGKGGLVTESGELPAVCGGDSDGLYADSAEAVVDDLAVGSGGNVTGLAHRHRQRGRNGDAHCGSGGSAAGCPVIGGAEIDRRRAGAARSADISGKCRDRHTQAEAKGKCESYELGSVLFHTVILLQNYRFYRHSRTVTVIIAPAQPR